MGWNVVLATDNEAIQHLFSETFEAKTDVQLAFCQTAEEVTEEILKSSPDLLIISVSLPDREGYDLCKELKEQRHVQFPVLLIEDIFEDIDCSFPNHEANPLDPKNVEDLKALVKDTQSDIGVIFDGDADRVMFVDENSRFISPDLIIAVLAHYFLKEKKEGVRVLQDIRTSKAVGEYIRKYNGEMHMWRVGRAYAALKLKEIDGLFGGELAGHYYFKDFYYSDSGLMAAILVLNIVSQKKKQGISFSEMIAEIETYKNSGEINFKLENKAQAMEAVKEHYFAIEKPDAFYDFDGYRIEYPDWWLNIRPSNTEPYLRFLAEAKSQTKLDEVVNNCKKIIESFA